MAKERHDAGPVDPQVDIVQLVGQHHRELYAYAFRLTGSVQDAEDLVQRTFLIAQQKGHQIRETAAARSWLFTVLRNCYLKDQRRQEPQLAENVDLDLEKVASDVPQELWFDSEQLQEAINRLPPQYKIVLMLFYFEECSYREIAERLGVAQGTVMSRLSRAKAHLRSRLVSTGNWMEPVPGRVANDH